jgi:hypothetical protein
MEEAPALDVNCTVGVGYIVSTRCARPVGTPQKDPQTQEKPRTKKAAQKPSQTPAGAP